MTTLEENYDPKKYHLKLSITVKKRKTDSNISQGYNEQNMKEAFAKIVSVENGSPAEEAGLKPEDHIINFNGILYKGVSHNPLITLSEIVKSKIGEEIPVSIVRKNKDNILEMNNLKIIPHTWNGRGVLGCKFQII